MYLLALLVPPLAVLLCGKIFQAVFSFLLCAGGIFTFGATWLLAAVHACIIVGNSAGKKRHKEMIRAIQSNR